MVEEKNKEMTCGHCPLIMGDIWQGFVYCTVLNQDVWAGSLMCKQGKDATEIF